MNNKITNLYFEKPSFKLAFPHLNNYYGFKVLFNLKKDNKNYNKLLSRVKKSRLFVKKNNKASNVFKKYNLILQPKTKRFIGYKKPNRVSLFNLSLLI